MRHIERNGYSAFDWPPDEMQLDGLLKRFPELVLGRFIAVLSFDSGPLVLSPEEEKKGWTRVGPIAFSPRITEIQDLPYECFDEWFIFDAPKFPAPLESFVKFLQFSPIDYSWDEKRELFWSQVKQYGPTSVVGDGSLCYLVTKLPGIIERLKEPNPEGRVPR